MLSRVADSLFWMSRYLERAEHIARQLDIHLNLVLDQSSEAAGKRRMRLLYCVTDGTDISRAVSDFDLTEHLTFNSKNTDALVNCVSLARENARQIREQINSLMWEQLNELYLSLKQARMDTIWNGQPHAFYHAINGSIYAIQGITDSRMSHDEGWQFIRLGQFLERSISIANLLDSEFKALYQPSLLASGGDQNTYLDWVGLLRGCAAFEAYSKFYTAEVQPRSVAEYLLLNQHFPHSIRFSINVIQSALTAIAGDTDTHKGAKVNRLAGRLGAMLDYAQVDEVIDAGLNGYLTDIRQRCFQIHDAIYQTYIGYPIEEKLSAS